VPPSPSSPCSSHQHRQGAQCPTERYPALSAPAPPTPCTRASLDSVHADRSLTHARQATRARSRALAEPRPCTRCPARRAATAAEPRTKSLTARAKQPSRAMPRANPEHATSVHLQKPKPKLLFLPLHLPLPVNGGNVPLMALNVVVSSPFMATVSSPLLHPGDILPSLLL
jgi:hypothetical protein